MKHRTRNFIAITLITGAALGCVLGGTYLIYRQKTGILTTVTVASCKKIRRAEVCSGLWIFEGKWKSGELENANSDDLGSQIEVMVTADRAVKPSLRLPIVLYIIAIGIVLLGWRWWQTEAQKD